MASVVRLQAFGREALVCNYKDMVIVIITSSGNWFNGFKVNLADRFDSQAVSMMLTYFDLPTRQRDEVQKSRNEGLELLSALEDREIIGHQVGIDKLCEALRHCRLIRTARETETLFSKLKDKSSQDAPDLGPVPNIDISKLKSKLYDELTSQQCYEVGMVAGLRAQVLQDIKDSRDSVNLLIDTLHDSGRIKSSDIRVLMFALERIQLIRVVKLIKNSDDLQTPGPASELETAVVYSRSTCICMERSFEELKSAEDESRILLLLCSSCSAEWLHPTVMPENSSASQPAGENLSLSWNNDTFLYKIPCKYDLSKLRNEDVADVSQLRRGDHIIFRRYWGSYDHHAILVKVDSDKLEVIEWTSRWMNWKLCASISLGNVNFPPGGVIRRIDKNSDHVEVVIARAFYMMNNSTEKYDLFTNNCETLATYCKVGKGISTQGKVLQDILPPGLRNVVRGFGGLSTIKNAVSNTRCDIS